MELTTFINDYDEMKQQEPSTTVGFDKELLDGPVHNISHLIKKKKK